MFPVSLATVQCYTCGSSVLCLFLLSTLLVPRYVRLADSYRPHTFVCETDPIGNAIFSPLRPIMIDLID